MKEPKSFTDSLVRRLNAACGDFSKVCSKHCDGIAWCDACWLAVGMEPKEEMDEDEGEISGSDRREHAGVEGG